MDVTLMDEKKLVDSLKYNRPRPAETDRIGRVSEEYIRRNLKSMQKQASVVDVWESVVPAGMRAQCRLSGIRGSVLKIEVTPGPYMHEMNLVRSELLDEIRRQCPRSGIKKIQLYPMKKEEE